MVDHDTEYLQSTHHTTKEFIQDAPTNEACRISWKPQQKTSRNLPSCGNLGERFT